MSILSSIGKLIGAIFSAIFKFIKKYLGVLLLIVLIVVAIYFAPVIAAWLGSVGAPTWMVEAFTWVGANITPLVTSTLTTVWNGVSTLATKAWTSFSEAKLGTQLAVATGVCAAIAPEETAALLSDVGSTAMDIVAATATGILSSPVGLGLAAFAVWYFFIRDDDPVRLIEREEPEWL